ncbi:NAD(P)H-dependent oxidoreductase [Roseobacter sp. EG26]|uniref:NAD(P)H-dependent oxidoreductase n=1 Tax=Roseobacter sp. EG26 TaxID=3412477 RepID=UPI003CE477CB
MTKRVYVLNGHPGEASLSRSLSIAYAEAAQKAGHEVRLTHLRDLAFDSDFGNGGYQSTKPLEPVLDLVLATPMWWGGIPAKLKGLFDRILLPGRTFDTRKKSFGLPSPMLSGRTARVILTSDTKSWLLRFVYHNAILNQLRCQIFSFVGIKPTRFTQFLEASHPNESTVARWLSDVRQLGRKAA